MIIVQQTSVLITFTPDPSPIPFSVFVETRHALSLQGDTRQIKIGAIILIEPTVQICNARKLN
jgi:hypothetical protein